MLTTEQTLIHELDAMSLSARDRPVGVCYCSQPAAGYLGFCEPHTDRVLDMAADIGRGTYNDEQED